MPWMNPMVVKAWDKLATYVRSDIFACTRCATRR